MTSGAGKAPRRASVDAARLAAYDVLVAVRQDDAYANLVLPQLLRERRIEGRDAAFTTELVGGTLRGLGTYDAVIDHLAGRPPDPSVRDALRLGAHQLLAMRVPDHAAVTSTVELVRTRVGHKPAGFTNAVLRRITSGSSSRGWTCSMRRRVCASPIHSGSSTISPGRWAGQTSWRPCWPPTTRGRE